MIKSMTGFGKHVSDNELARITIELKSLNSKLLDINCRLPSQFRIYEIDMRNLLGTNLQRGKVDCLVSVEMKTPATAAVINQEVARHYYEQFKSVTKALGISAGDEFFSDILKMPDIFLTNEHEADENEWNQLKDGLVAAMEALDTFRTEEGRMIETDFRDRIRQIIQLLEKVETYEPARVERIRDRIQNHLAMMRENEGDENRFEQEMIFYIEKLDITEEKVRLKKHCEYFLETMDSADSAGKKLGFISQEIGREINTLGSKANDVEIQKLVVLMKDELEKIKEQLSNIL